MTILEVFCYVYTMNKSPRSGQNNLLCKQERLRLAELKEWKSPQITSVPLSMTEGKDAQWFEGPAFGLNWSAAPS